MLKVMRENVQSKFIKVLLWAVIASFVLGVFLISGRGDEGLGGNPSIVARVGKVELDKYTFNQRFQMLTRDNDNKQAQAQAATQIIQEFIREQLWLEEASNLGITVTSKELFDAIMDYKDPNGRYVFRDENGKFIGADVYKRRLAAARVSPGAFEADMKRQMVLRKLQNLLLSGIEVNDSETLEYYKLQNEKVRLTIIKFESKIMESEIIIEEVNMKKFFEDNKEDFRRPLENKYGIFTLDLAPYLTKIEIKPDEPRKYYNSHKEDYYIGEERKARHILLKVEQGSDAQQDEKIRLEAEKIFELAKKDGADFNELAKKYSEDQTTAVNGGLLNFAVKGTYQKPFDSALFRMKVGDIHGLVKTVFGYHIIQLVEIQPSRYKELTEVRYEITDKLKQFKAIDMRDRNLEEITQKLEENTDWEKLAGDLGFVYRATDYFTPGAVPRGLPYSDDLRVTLTEMEDPGEISDPIKGTEEVFFVKLLERRPSHIPPFEDVKYNIEARFKSEQGVLLAEKRASEAFEKIKNGTPADEAVVGSGGTFETPEPITKQGTLPNIGRIAEMNFQVFGGETGDITGPFKYPGGFVIAVTEEKIEADYNKFLVETKTIKTQLLNQKQNNALIANLELLASDADIDTNQEFLQEFLK